MWVSKKKAADLLGITDGQIRSKIQRNVWLKDSHYRVIDRATWINIEEVQKWICPNTSNITMDHLESTLCLKAKGLEKPQHFKRLKVV